jgi:hypothetical protein
MNIISYTVEPIEVEVNDLVIGATVIKQKVKFSHFAFQHTDNGQAVVAVVLNVSRYAKNEDGTIGQKLEGKGFQTYQQSLIADNETYVNPQTGELLWWHEKGQSIEDFEVEIGDTPVMKQGDFFDNLAREVEIMVVPLIMLHINSAIQMGKFNL